jgi:hypothetical protein
MAVVTLPCPCCPQGGSGSGSGSGGGPPDPPVGPCCDWPTDESCPEELTATATVCSLSCTKTLLKGSCGGGAFEYADDPTLHTSVNGDCEACPPVFGPTWLDETVCAIQLECSTDEEGVATVRSTGQMASATALVKWRECPVTIVSCNPFYAYIEVEVVCNFLAEPTGVNCAATVCEACAGETLFIEFTQ